MDGLITRDSANDVPTTVARLTDALRTKGITLFANIDHSALAIEAGLELRPTVVMIFGSPKSGTPLMQAGQTAGIDLPLKALIWEDAAGKTHFSYNDPAWVAVRHGLGGGVEKQVAGLSAMLAALAGTATTLPR
ncbi:MAG TPA: DUF302 domain-containing protein [Rhizomicrobium sp.]|jgi:uncharacterized protein (DUF302 family)